VRKFLIGLLWITGILAIVVLILRLTMFKVWTIPDDLVLDSSMRPTLASGDLVILMTSGERGFGNLVRCTDPEDPQRYVVGRIVGLQGDEIVVKPPSVSVNGTIYNTGDSCGMKDFEVPHPTSGAPVAAQCQRVDMGGGWHYRAYVPSPEGESKHKVGPGRVFLLSDDRGFHDDSRDFGAVPAETCTNLVLFRLWGKAGWSDAEHRLMYIR
jgi:signal peptidase I